MRPQAEGHRLGAQYQTTQGRLAYSNPIAIEPWTGVFIHLWALPIDNHSLVRRLRTLERASLRAGEDSLRTGARPAQGAATTMDGWFGAVG